MFLDEPWPTLLIVQHPIVIWVVRGHIRMPVPPIAHCTCNKLHAQLLAS